VSSVLLIRHGQASFGASEYDALSALGEAQSRHLGETLRARLVRPDHILSGSMRRHRQTAAGCLAAMGLSPQWTEDTGWNEYDHLDVLAASQSPGIRPGGAMPASPVGSDGKRAFQAHFEQAVARWTGGEHDGDYRESWPAFTRRIEAALERLCGQLGRSQTALVFTSGGVISAVCRLLLMLSDASTQRINWSIANASVTKLLVGGSGLRLSSLNEHAHFEGPNAALLSYR